MIKYSLDLTTKQELRFLSDLVADLRAEIPKILRSTLAAETDPKGPLRLIGELSVSDPERSRLALAAFLSGFNGNQQPF
jgi:hypothetical protein